MTDLHDQVVESLKATASELEGQPPEEMNRDWADRMAAGLAAAGLLAAPALLTDDQQWQWRASMIADLSGLDYVTDDDSPDSRAYFEAIADGLLKAGWRFGGVSPAVPADDEAAIERMTEAIWNGFFSSPKWDDEIEWKSRALWRGLARAALAALREEQ